MKKKGLYLLLPVRCVVFILVFVTGGLIVGKELSDITCWWSVVATIVNLLNIFMLVAAAKSQEKTYFELINYKKGVTKIKQIAGISALVLVGGMGCMYLAGFICYGVFPYLAPMMAAPLPSVLAVANILLLPVTTALAEDGLYLGCGVNQIENKYAAILVPAFFYALQHCFIPTLPDIRYIMYRFLSFLPLTIILCWYYHKKRDPLPIMIGHALIDVATVVLIAVTSLNPGLYESMTKA